MYQWSESGPGGVCGTSTLREEKPAPLSTSHPSPLLLSYFLTAPATRYYFCCRPPR
ncbi:hypothetical protein E2C01_063714 [Portunus trituberculatus]|uniref:Uncharacterized protein n=1 Tax=Portunus trituberculatus TaxID=210409 RepID=A0A5B7HL98_PORTR|nr:hypothetical protein [Portunus trituberculatus]